MNSDNSGELDALQQAWKSEADRTRITIDADLLLKQVQRDQNNFRSTIFWRDFREVVIAIGLIPIWVYLGVSIDTPWTWYLTIPVLIWIAGFMLVYRLRFPQRPSLPDEPLVDCIRRSLSDIENQIWLLRNVFWWYLLPPSVSIAIFFIHSTLQDARTPLDAMVLVPLLLFVFGLYYFIYWINQYAVDNGQEPRRLELRALLQNLGEPAAEIPENVPGARAQSVRSMLWIVLGSLAVSFLIMNILDPIYEFQTSDLSDPIVGYEKKSPFSAVRWNNSEPEVQVNETWYQLTAINGVPKTDLLAFSQQTFEGKWQKRFEEDLVELMDRMGHPVGDTVELTVQDLNTGETLVLEDIPMTEENRRAIRNAARARSR